MQMSAPRGALALGEQHRTCQDKPSFALRHYHHTTTQCFEFLSKMGKEMAWGKEFISVSLERNEAPQEVFISQSQPVRHFGVITWENKSTQLWTLHPPSRFHMIQQAVRLGNCWRRLKKGLLVGHPTDRAPPWWHVAASMFCNISCVSIHLFVCTFWNIA